jgi:hypothetical protein
MYYKLLSDRDLKAMDALLDSYGGAKAIQEKIEDIRGYEQRKKKAQNLGYGEMLEKA